MNAMQSNWRNQKICSKYHLTLKSLSLTTLSALLFSISQIDWPQSIFLPLQCNPPTSSVLSEHLFDSTTGRVLKTSKYLQNEEKETKRKLQLRHFAAQCFGPKRCQFFLTLLELHGIVAVASQRCCYKFCSSTSSSIAFFTLKSCFLSVVKFAIFFVLTRFWRVLVVFAVQLQKIFACCVYVYIYPYTPSTPSSHCLIFYLCIFYIYWATTTSSIVPGFCCFILNTQFAFIYMLGK